MHDHFPCIALLAIMEIFITCLIRYRHRVSSNVSFTCWLLNLFNYTSFSIMLPTINDIFTFSIFMFNLTYIWARVGRLFALLTLEVYNVDQTLVVVIVRVLRDFVLFPILSGVNFKSSNTKNAFILISIWILILICKVLFHFKY